MQSVTVVRPASGHGGAVRAVQSGGGGGAGGDHQSPADARQEAEEGQRPGPAHGEAGGRGSVLQAPFDGLLMQPFVHSLIHSFVRSFIDSLCDDFY